MTTFLQRVLLMILALVLIEAPTFARGGRGGGGGGMSRAGARSSVNSGPRAGGGTRDVGDRNVGADRNVNVNRDVNRDINRDVDVHRGYYGGRGCCYHPVAAGVAVGATAAVTALAIGSVVSSIPPSCVPVVVTAVTYQQCGSTWYQPQFSGTSTTYVVVNPP